MYPFPFLHESRCLGEVPKFHVVIRSQQGVTAHGEWGVASPLQSTDTVGWSADPDPYMDSLGYRYVAHNLTEYNIFLLPHSYPSMVTKSGIMNL